MRLKDFNETFEYQLRDPEYAGWYLHYALDDGVENFLIALRDVAKANGGMTKVAELTDLGRESMYKALSEDGNPKIKTIQSVLKALGFRLSVQQDTKKRKSDPVKKPVTPSSKQIKKEEAVLTAGRSH